MTTAYTLPAMHGEVPDDDSQSAAMQTGHAADRHGDMRAELARVAARLIADGREQHLEAALQRARHELRLSSDVRFPTRLELRKHMQALEESRVGEFGRRQRVVEVLEEALEFLSTLERTVVAFDRDGVDRRPPEVYGRAVQGELDLDPVVHMRVETSVRAHVLATALARNARCDVECGAFETRYGMIDELRLDTALAAYRILRIPPRMRVDPDLTVTRGERVPHAGYEELSRRLAQLLTR